MTAARKGSDSSARSSAAGAVRSRSRLARRPSRSRPTAAAHTRARAPTRSPAPGSAAASAGSWRSSASRALGCARAAGPSAQHPRPSPPRRSPAALAQLRAARAAPAARPAAPLRTTGLHAWPHGHALGCRPAAWGCGHRRAVFSGRLGRAMTSRALRRPASLLPPAVWTAHKRAHAVTHKNSSPAGVSRTTRLKHGQRARERVQQLAARGRTRGRVPQLRQRRGGRCRQRRERAVRMRRGRQRRARGRGRDRRVRRCQQRPQVLAHLARRPL